MLRLLRSNSTVIAPCDRQQGGNVLITVVIVMLLTTMLAGAILEHFLVNEARAVEASLAKVRVYWAMSGHVDYVLSRAREKAQDLINTSSTSPTIADFAATLQTFDFTVDPGATLCGTTEDSAEIYQCFFRGLETDDTNDTRDWVYDGYTLVITNARNSTNTTDLQFQLTSTNTDGQSFLDNLEQQTRTLNMNATMNSSTGAITITNYYRVHPSQL